MWGVGIFCRGASMTNTTKIMLGQMSTTMGRKGGGGVGTKVERH